MGGAPSWSNNLMARGTIAGPGGLALADATSRFIAAFIDYVILGIIGYIVNTVTTSVLGDNLLGFLGLVYKTQSLIGALITVVVMLAISGAYFIGTWTRMNGATVGMRVMKLAVRDVATGGPITQQQAINRWLVFGAPYALAWFQWSIIGLILSIAVLVYYIYLMVTISQNPMRQGFHDLYAKTVVAKLAM
jgi:uncharacterized RDD family membrane protein YckC